MRRDLLVAGAILAVALATRAYAFTQSVIDWDESLYALVARDLVAGALPYTTVWECKPPLLFAIFGLGFKVFGVSVVALRWLAVIAVATTAFLVYRVGMLFPRSPVLAGTVAAAFFLAMSLADGGIASNAELFVLPFETAAAYLLLRRPRLRSGGAVAVGILIAVAVQVKETAFVPSLVLCTIALWQKRLTVREGILIAVTVAAGIALIAAPFALTGNLDVYLDANLFADLRRLYVPRSAVNAPAIAAAQLWELAPAIEIAIGFGIARLVRRSSEHGDELLLPLAGWAAAVLATIVAIGDYPGHQFVEAMPPLALLAAAPLAGWLAALHRPVAASALTCVLAVGMHDAVFTQRAIEVARHRAGDATYGDPVAAFAARAKPALAEDQSLFVASGQPILYLLLERQAPTRYPYPPHLNDPRLRAVAGTADGRELRRIRASKPHFIVSVSAAPRGYLRLFSESGTTLYRAQSSARSSAKP